MKSTTETLSPTRVKLTIEVPFDEFKPALDKAYKTIGSQITIPGFRKGKVPAAIIDQRVGRGAVLDEAINSALPGWYNEAVTEQSIKPLSQPEIDLTKFEDGETIEVTAELDVRPEIEIPDITGISVEVAAAEISEADIDEQLNALRERFATFTEVDRAAGEGDQVTIDLSAAHKDGALIEDAQATGMPYFVGRNTMLDGLDEAITGLSNGESATFETQLVGGELAGQDVDVTVTVNDIKATELPEADDEFAQMVSEFDTIAEVRDDLRERLTRGKRLEQAAEAQDLVLQQLIDQIDVELPETMLEAEVTARRQQMDQQLAMAGLTLENYLADEEDGKSVEDFEADLAKNVRDGIVTQFLLDQIVERDDIQLGDAELSQHIMRRAQQSGEDPSAYVQHIMEHNHLPEMIGEVQRGKAIAALVENATVTDSAGATVRLVGLQGDGSYADESAEAAKPTEA